MRTLCGTILAAVLSLSANANSVASFCERAEKGERLTVAFLGGSLSWGANATDPNKASWRALVGRRRPEAGGVGFSWRDVLYAQGSIRAVAYRKGRVWAEKTVETTGCPSRLVAEPETTRIPNIFAHRRQWQFYIANGKNVPIFPLAAENYKYSLERMVA